MSQPLPRRPHVWLAYVMYPVTTAAYWERALRQIARVTTLGPRLPDQLIEQWDLKAMRVPVRDQDIPTDFRPDLRAILARTPKEDWPDLFIWVESVGGFEPQHLDALPCPKVCQVIDSHLPSNRQFHLQWGKQFDFLFAAQLEYVPLFRDSGIRAAHWMPLGCDIEVHRPPEPAPAIDYEIGFVGSLGGDPRRARVLEHLRQVFDLYYERCFWDDMATVFARGMLGFNHAVNNDLNMRFFELLSIGTPQLANLALNSGQDRLFVAGEDYILYDYDNVLAQARHYIVDEAARLAIAARGRQLAHAAHQYRHRVEEVLRVALEGKPAPPTPEEWRERSLQGLAKPPAPTFSRPKELDPEERSFIIPVLDYSPASPYNIRTLLEDLEKVPGEVIVIFNNEQVGQELKGHPRINLSAIMSHNVGVPRAWNIGVHLASTPTLFFMNADLKITSRKAVDLLQRALWTLPDAAIVGPQGGMTDLATYRCIHYFDHDQNRAKEVTEVTDISGFFFATQRRLFLDKTLEFWDELSPCYGEEWDIGLQARQAGLKCYVVPTPGYIHEWSGTIRGLKTIRYLRDGEITAIKSHHRNKRAMWKKWGVVTPSSPRP